MSPAVSDVRVEHLDAALGIDEARPRLSWQVDEREEPAGFEIAIDREDGSAERAVSRTASLVPWPGKPLGFRERAVVRVRALAVDGVEGPWSTPAHVERGIASGDWCAPWVSPSSQATSDGPRPAYLMRAEFDRPADAVRVRAYIAVHGVYELELDGEVAGDGALAPGWTSFKHRLRYQTIDLDHTAEGRHALGLWLADGWYRGRLGFNGGLWDVYGSDVAARVQVEILLADGTRVQPELAWRWAPAPIVSAGLYEGESYDARLEQSAWSQPGLNDQDWTLATILDATLFDAALEGPLGPPVRCTEELAPVDVQIRPGGRVRLDFGQNVSGRLRLSAIAPAGHHLTIRHAEVLEDDELALRPLRSATSVDQYVFAGTGPETWEPRFTVHGFRYAEIDGWPEGQPINVVARVLHSDMRRTGWFASSHPLLNRFHENVVWSMRDNFVDLPTDCPQRDERLGWTGDIQAFAPTAAFLYDSTGVLRSWLRDVAVEQAADGTMRNFHPWLDCGFPPPPAAGWGDAAVIVPWTIFERTGDQQVLRDQLTSMTAWVDQVSALTHGTGLWNESFQLGDWLDPAAPPDRPGDSATDPHLVATAYHAYTSRLTASACDVLGESAMAVRYEAVADRALRAFRREFVAPSGRVVSDTVTALALAIHFDLLETDAQRDAAGRRLAELVRANDHRIATGFIGTPIVCDALVATGAVDTAYHLLLQTQCPSWLYPVTMGATTVWERWDSLLPDGTVNPGEMTSFNHYALGAVADFLHRVVAGLAPASPGYARVRVAPVPGGGLTCAQARHLSPHGLIDVGWKRTAETLRITVTLPAGVAGDLQVPGEAGLRELAGGTTVVEVPFRSADDDPPMPRLWNVHNPEDRLEMIAAGAEA
ncbi:family 78 glycoside hydrolase catalytic domain [Cellulomonas sp. JH27-2]|uniref:alpha-L-rhamnosidase n=1 Tax=Cellulomonas sp. JH27-2 TaxID=2774139 RepID=UPI00177D64A7|nr:alpha-L-rhamnosidase [Cellulomonas sp. JH27-2]MBD8059198.1 family 78 glycoside hydrolase catalytic domain [Cellulomonas sp. JH27-2]